MRSPGKSIYILSGIMRFMRKFILAIVIMLAAVFFLAHASEITSIAETIRQADLSYIFFAILVITCYLLSTAMIYRSIYQSLGLREKFVRMATLVAAAFFINIVAPSAGMGGIAVFVSEARQNNISTARVMVANAVIVFLDYIGFLTVLSLGLIVLIRRSMLSSPELIASSLLIAFISLLGVLIYTGMRSSDALGNLLARLARTFNRLIWPIIHRDYINEYRAHEFAHDAADGLYQLRRNPKRLIIPFTQTLANKVMLIMIFLCCFLAYKVPFSPGTIIAGWSLAYLFVIVSPTPGGLGVVEGVLPLLLTTLYVPLGAAALIILTYRAITLWLPLFFGMLAFNWLARHDKSQIAVT